MEKDWLISAQTSRDRIPAPARQMTASSGIGTSVLLLYCRQLVATHAEAVAVGKDDVSAADQAVTASVAGLGSISGCGGLIQTTSG